MLPDRKRTRVGVQSQAGFNMVSFLTGSDEVWNRGSGFLRSPVAACQTKTEKKTGSESNSSNFMNSLKMRKWWSQLKIQALKGEKKKFMLCDNFLLRELPSTGQYEYYCSSITFTFVSTMHFIARQSWQHFFCFRHLVHGTSCWWCQPETGPVRLLLPPLLILMFFIFRGKFHILSTELFLPSAANSSVRKVATGSPKSFWKSPADIIDFLA